MTQSSRIFPISGQISEDVVYEVRDGVAYGYGTRTRYCRTCLLPHRLALTRASASAITVIRSVPSRTITTARKRGWPSRIWGTGFPHPTTARGGDVLSARGTHYPIY